MAVVSCENQTRADFMTATLVIGLPVLSILLIVISLKLKASFSFLLIFALGIASPFVVDFVYCFVLGKECVFRFVRTAVPVSSGHLIFSS